MCGKAYKQIIIKSLVFFYFKYLFFMSNNHKRKTKTLNQIAQTNSWCVNILFHAGRGDLFNLNLKNKISS
jgi:hypothetical protein